MADKLITEFSIIRPADYISTEDAAKKIGVEEKTIRDYLYRENLTRFKWYQLVLVSVKEIEAILKRRKDDEPDLY